MVRSSYEKESARNVLRQLAGGGRNSLGKADSLSRCASADRRVFRQLIAAMWHDDPVIRMRAADAVEKASREQPRLLTPFKGELLGLLKQEQQQEVRWHLAMMTPRLPLTHPERLGAAATFREWLGDSGSIVRTCALQALFDLAQQEPSLREETLELLRAAQQSGTAAMKARSRKLLKQMEND
jgi:hypothetical protein